MSQDAVERKHFRTVAAGEDFELLLAVGDGGRATLPTHVIILQGNEAEFLAALQDRLLEDDVEARALRGPVGTISLGQLADVLNAIGPATVQSIDRM